MVEEVLDKVLVKRILQSLEDGEINLELALLSNWSRPVCLWLLSQLESSETQPDRPECPLAVITAGPQLQRCPSHKQRQTKQQVNITNLI